MTKIQSSLPFLIASTILCSVQGYIQQLELHEGLQGNGTVFIFQRDVPDTSKYDFTRIQLVCASGHWPVYSEINYDTSGGVAFGSTDGQRSCWQWTFPFASFRHSGPLDTDVDSLSLFQKVFFAGQVLLLNETSLVEITQPVKSFIVTGKSQWTLFEGANFEGKSFCTKNPTVDGVTGSTDLECDSGLPTVGSVAKGCGMRHENLIDLIGEPFHRNPWCPNGTISL